MTYTVKKLIFVALILTNTSSVAATLVDFQWRNRLLIVQFDNKQTEQLWHAESLQQLAAIDERKLIIWTLSGKKRLHQICEAQQLAPNGSELAATVNGYQGVLIGLDGRIKARYHHAVLSNVFADIDAMPMRRAQLQG